MCWKGTSKSVEIQNLVMEIKALEMMLICRLDIIHIPGISMITQGVDDISQEVWQTNLRIEQNNPSGQLFCSLLAEPAVVDDLIQNRKNRNE